MILKTLLSWHNKRQALKRLAQIVAQNRASYENRRFRERRAAALKGLGKA